MTTEPVGLRSLQCYHCKKRISATNLPNVIGFCDDACLQSFICEQVLETNEKVLKGLSAKTYRDAMK